MAEPKDRETKPQSAPAESIPGGQVAVLGSTQSAVAPQATAAPAVPPPRDPKSPYTGPTEMVPGGRFIQAAVLRGGQHYGGRIVNAHGVVLATFAPDQVNTGAVEDGTPPPKG